LKHDSAFFLKDDFGEGAAVAGHFSRFFEEKDKFQCLRSDLDFIFTEIMAASLCGMQIAPG
jgi:hypothetical protein